MVQVSRIGVFGSSESSKGKISWVLNVSPEKGA